MVVVWIYDCIWKSKIEHPTKKGTHCPEAKGRPSTTAGVLLNSTAAEALCSTATLSRR